MELEQVKQYLRVTFNDEDSTLEQLIAVSGAYLAGAVDDYDKKYKASEHFAAAADMTQLAIIADLYENRNQAEKGATDYGFVVRSLITQLQYTEV